MEWISKGKRKDNGEWVKGFYFSMVHDDGRHTHYFIIPLGADLSLGTPIEKIQVEIDPETVCQYTGCLTSDIKKIFVNDIVGVDDIIGVVKFGKYGNCFHLGYYIQWINSEFRQELGFWDGKVKHLGNVFDNLELIKG